jgi:hypothetical protein
MQAEKLRVCLESENALKRHTKMVKNSEKCRETGKTEQKNYKSYKVWQIIEIRVCLESKNVPKRHTTQKTGLWNDNERRIYK